MKEKDLRFLILDGPEVEVENRLKRATAIRLLFYEGDPLWLARTLDLSISGVYLCGSKGSVSELIRFTYDGGGSNELANPSELPGV